MRYDRSFVSKFCHSSEAKNNESAGLSVSATTRDAKSVTVRINGIEKINFPINPVIKSIAEKIQTTVKVVEISTRLKSRITSRIASLVVNFPDRLY